MLSSHLFTPNLFSIETLVPLRLYYCYFPQLLRAKVKEISILIHTVTKESGARWDKIRDLRRTVLQHSYLNMKTFIPWWDLLSLKRNKTQIFTFVNGSISTQ